MEEDVERKQRDLVQDRFTWAVNLVSSVFSKPTNTGSLESYHNLQKYEIEMMKLLNETLSQLNVKLQENQK